LTGRRSVEEYTNDMATWYERDGWKIGDPKRVAATRLVEYLTGSGRVKSSRAVCLRTAVIGNEFWRWGFKLSTTPDGKRQCPGVYRLVTRPRQSAL
jgi:hypothetical protein